MRVRPDPFLVLLLVTVGVASLFPARGAMVGVVDVAVTAAIALLFFLYGARLSAAEALGGLRNWRLHGTVLAATFVLFPLLGLSVLLLPEWLLPAPLAALDLVLFVIKWSPGKLWNGTLVCATGSIRGCRLSSQL